MAADGLTADEQALEELVEALWSAQDAQMDAGDFSSDFAEEVTRWQATEEAWRADRQRRGARIPPRQIRLRLRDGRAARPATPRERRPRRRRTTARGKPSREPPEPEPPSSDEDASLGPEGGP
jgi:hypothetical protein